MYSTGAICTSHVVKILEHHNYKISTVHSTADWLDCLDCGRIQENPCRQRENVQSPHWEATGPESNLQPSCWKAATLTTAHCLPRHCSTSKKQTKPYWLLIRRLCWCPTCDCLHLRVFARRVAVTVMIRVSFSRKSAAGIAEGRQGGLQQGPSCIRALSGCACLHVRHTGGTAVLGLYIVLDNMCKKYIYIPAVGRHHSHFDRW